MISSQWTAQLAAVVPEIKPLHIEASALLQGFPNIRVSWVPRKWNAGADALHQGTSWSIARWYAGASESVASAQARGPTRLPIASVASPVRIDFRCEPNTLAASAPLRDMR